jgi:hypothetical protein
MAEEQAAKTRATTPRRPWWRRRRFWQIVIAVEFAGALAVSYLAASAMEEGSLSTRVGGGTGGAEIVGGVVCSGVAGYHSGWYLPS